jgi:hypothetical protein
MREIITSSSSRHFMEFSVPCLLSKIPQWFRNAVYTVLPFYCIISLLLSHFRLGFSGRLILSDFLPKFSVHLDYFLLCATCPALSLSLIWSLKYKLLRRHRNVRRLFNNKQLKNYSYFKKYVCSLKSLLEKIITLSQKRARFWDFGHIDAYLDYYSDT